VPGLSEAAKAALTGYRWPGNVRELQNVIERAVILAYGDIDASLLNLEGVAERKSPIPGGGIVPGEGALQASERETDPEGAVGGRGNRKRRRRCWESPCGPCSTGSRSMACEGARFAREVQILRSRRWAVWRARFELPIEIGVLCMIPWPARTLLIPSSRVEQTT